MTASLGSVSPWSISSRLKRSIGRGCVRYGMASIWLFGLVFFSSRNFSSFLDRGSGSLVDIAGLDWSAEDFLLVAAPTGTPKFQNRPRIQGILSVNASYWGPFQAIPQPANSTMENTTEIQKTKTIDVTQNVVRVEEFLETRTKKERMTLNEEDEGSPRLLNEPQHLPPAPAETEEGKREPLNIVLFYADDWTMKVLGALNPHVITPNIDGMADRGMLFTRNCVTTSICWISRNTLATGVYMAVHKTQRIAGRNMFNVTVPWLDTLYPLLKRHGYFTGLVGKWHAPAPPEFMEHTFDRSNFYYGSHWMHRDGRNRHVTDLNGEDAIQFLRTRPMDKKFSLTVAFFATHAHDNHNPPYSPMPESMSLYQDGEIPPPKTATDEHYQALPWFMKTRRNEARKRWINRFDTKENYQDKIKNLYRMATEVDAVVGAVIAELKTQGVYNRTLLVFTTDNGNLHGEHGLAEKWYPYEESIRVPLVIEDPRMPESARGTRNDEFTLSVDLAPTLLQAANIPVPAFMQGRDISQLYMPQATAAEHGPQSWRQDFFYEWTLGDPVTAVGHGFVDHLPSVFALVRKDYKYFYWPQTNYEQLFNVEQDPYEESDLFKNNATSTAQALRLMRARYEFLKRWAQEGNPV